MFARTHAISLRPRRALVAAPALALAMLAIAASSASAFYYQWGAHVGPLYSGQNTRDPDYHGTIYHLDGNSTGTAYSGVYVVNSSNVRVSADSYCNSPGCTANINWDGPYPAGFASVHNHGNASPSYFDAAVGWW